MSADRRLIYLVGEPGVGKSATLATITDHLRRAVIDEQPRRELLLDGDTIVACELGARAGRHMRGHPGTDALPMNAVISAEQWLVSGQAAAEAPLILAEGARLANRRFLHAALTSGWRVSVVLLVSTRAADNRRARGSNQSETWVRGARTRALRFWEYASDLVGHGHGVAAAYRVHADDLASAATTVRQLAYHAEPACTS